MEVPRGFTRCDSCEGEGDKRCDAASHQWFGGDDIHRDPCPSCSGSGLVPTEKLREDVARIIERNDSGTVDYSERKADAVLAKVAEHLGGGE